MLRQVVGIGTVTQEPVTTGGPSPTKPPVTTKSPIAIGNPTPPGLTDTPPTATPGETVTIDDNKSEGKFEGTGNAETIQDFLNMYTEIVDLSEKMERSLVRITSYIVPIFIVLSTISHGFLSYTILKIIVHITYAIFFYSFYIYNQSYGRN
jgi:hypothetical protein